MTRLGGREGLSLTELLITSVISMVVLFGLIALDNTRIQISQQTRSNAAVRYPDRAETQIAALRITRSAQEADRFVIINGGAGVQLRAPRRPMTRDCPLINNSCTGAGPPRACCFDIPNNYQWDQYSRTGGGGLNYYSDTAAGGGCAATNLVSANLAGVTFAANAQNPNVLSFRLMWQNPDDATDTLTFPGDVALRGRTMGPTAGSAGVTTGLQAPWAALNVPAVCP